MASILLWRFPQAPLPDPLMSAVKRVEGLGGQRFSEARVMAAVVDGEGRIVAANRLFLDRAAVPDQAIPGTRFIDLVEIGEDDQMRLVADGESAPSLRAVHVPAEPTAKAGPGPSSCSTTRPPVRLRNPRTFRRCSMSFPSASLWSTAMAVS